MPKYSKITFPCVLCGEHLDRDIEILERKVLNNSFLYYGDVCPEHPNSCQDGPLSSRTLSTPDFMDRANLGKMTF